MKAHHRAALTFAIVSALAAHASADPAPVAPMPAPTSMPGANLQRNLHLTSASTLTTDGGSVVRLPRGYFTDEATRAALDVEVRRLQTAEVRLTAENTSLRSSASAFSCGPWCIGAIVLVGLATGAYVAPKL